LGGGYGCNSIGADFLDVGRCGREDGNTVVLAWRGWLAIGVHRKLVASYCIQQSRLVQLYWGLHVRTQAGLHALPPHDRRPFLIHPPCRWRPRSQPIHTGRGVPIPGIFSLVELGIQQSVHLLIKRLGHLLWSLRSQYRCSRCLCGHRFGAGKPSTSCGFGCEARHGGPRVGYCRRHLRGG
jgi:hypothetical protein